MQVRRSIAAAAAAAQTLPQVDHLERFAEASRQRGRKQQPPVLAAPADGDQRCLALYQVA